MSLKTKIILSFKLKNSIQIYFYYILICLHNNYFLSCSETINVIITWGAILVIYVGNPTHNPDNPVC